MSILVFDTATTGLLREELSLKDQTQPRMMQLGAVLYSSKWEEVGMMSVLLQPDGWAPKAGASAQHGITLRRCELYGVRSKAALATFMDMVRSTREIASYGWSFDASMIQIELLRIAARPDDWKRGGLKRTCIKTMAQQRWSGGRPMKLTAAHWAATDQVYEQTHNALDDARAAARILRNLMEKK